MKISVRKMIAEDLEAVAKLAEEGFGESYPFDWRANAEGLFAAASSGRAFVAVAEADGKVVGYCNLRSWPAGGWVDQIAVAAGQRRLGVGRALVDAILAEAVERRFWKVSLITSELDRGARSFFESCGWDQVGMMRDEIRKGVNGVLLSRIVDYRLHPNQ